MPTFAELRDRARERRSQQQDQPGTQQSTIVTPEENQEGGGPLSRLLGGLADVGRLVPQGVRDAAGTVAKDVLSAEEALNVPGADIGTAIRTFLEEKTPEVPVLGNLPGRAAGLAFDIGLSPATLLTAGAGGPGGPLLRGLGSLGKPGTLAAAFVAPASAAPRVSTRLLSETVMGTTGVLASEEAAARGNSGPVSMAAGVIGGGVGLGLLRIAKGAGGTIRRSAPRDIEQQFGIPLPKNNQFVNSLPKFHDVLAEVQPATGVLETSRAGRIVNLVVDVSKRIESTFGRGYMAFERQLRVSQQLSELSTGAALDAHNTKAGVAMGRRGQIFKVLDDGTVENLELPEGMSRHVNDVFLNPLARRFMSDKQKAYFDDFHKLYGELQNEAIKSGIEGTGVDLRDVMLAIRAGAGETVDLKGVKMDTPYLQNVFASAREAVAGGAKLVNDPREAMITYARSVYREIAGTQLDTYMGTITVTPATALKRVLTRENPNLLLRFKTATSALDKARARIDPDASAGVQRKNNKRLADARKELGEARSDYNIAKAGIEKRNLTTPVLPEYVFGRNNSDVSVPVVKWKGAFLQEDADFLRLRDQVDTLTGRPYPVKLDPVSTKIRDVADIVRFASATGDLAMPFIQGLPLFGQNPKLWAQMTYNHYKAFIDPSAQARYLRTNIDTLSRMAQLGIPIGDVEQLIATSRVGFIRAAARADIAGVPVGRQGLGRFEAAYDAGLTSQRLLAFQALEPVWDGTPAELAQYIRNMSGGLDSAALGISPQRRALEGAWLGFSPRLMRSTIALVAQAVNPDSAAGRQAARTLLNLSAFATGMAVTANIGLGWANGESQDQIEARIKDTLNPLGGRRFLSLNINDNWYGVGGQVRAITQFVAKAMANPSGFTTADQFENPLINFYMSRGAPGVTLGGAAIEAATGERVNILPFDQIDSPRDLLPFQSLDNPVDIFGFYGTALMPFVVQSIIETQSLANALPEFVGTRVTEVTARDLRSRAAVERFGKPFGELTGDEKSLLEEDRADLFAQVEEESASFGGREARKEAQTLNQLDTDRLAGEGALVDAFQRNAITPKEFRDEMSILQRFTAEHKRKIRGEVDFDTDDVNKQALTQFYDLYETSKIAGTDRVDWDLHAKLLSDFESTITPEQQRFVDQRTRAEHNPAAAWYFDNEAIIRDAQYWDEIDVAFNRMRNSIPVDIQSYRQLVLGIQAAVDEGDRFTGQRLATIQSRILSLTDRAREILRRRNPVLDRALFENGRVTVRVTRD